MSIMKLLDESANEINKKTDLFIKDEKQQDQQI